MKSLIAPVFVILAAIGFSEHSIAITDHDAHGSHSAMHMSTAAETPPAEETVKKIDKLTGKVMASQGALRNSEINASRSEPASPGSHTHKHTDNQ
ncbi:hypothetical protein [Methylobacter sp. BlB1]|jgi:Cu/Ag efflux protein CusF|uniref:hypothetical protein n=1 Tax=Methylobacter sp. BlB1 TaxID=2785914 RepID=UPI0018954E43|nr:hypothetical protein [Methylobacter sp. BlB1]MBF6649782.1 hypothetical protein [Methylobacter sp. BlB1]